MILRIVAASVATLFLLISACSVKSFTPDVGFEHVLIKKPLFFGDEGVVETPVKTGRTWGVRTTEEVKVYMQPRRYDLDLKDTMTSDGVPISFHAIMTIQVTDSVSLIKNFGAYWYENNLEQPYSQMIRQAVRKRGMNETAISTSAIEQIDHEIRDGMIKFIAENKLPVKLIVMTVGKANPPDAVKTQRIETAKQQQRIQTEQQTKLAEDQRKMAEESRAVADNAYREKMQLNPEQFLQLEAIKAQVVMCGPDGKATCTIVHNGATPVFNVNGK